MPVDRNSPLLSEDVVDRYLAILRVKRADPSLGALRELVKAHLTRVPFENISKIYYRKRLGLTTLPDIRLYLEGIEKHCFGGTCYANNYHLHLLLCALGYDAKLCAADMKTPGVHAVNIVTLDGREYLVDSGYAAPFLEPMPRDLETDYEIRMGRDRYVLRPRDANGCSRLELYRDGVLCHGYLAKPVPRRIEDFGKVITGSFSAQATFLNSILLARFRPEGSVVIHNLTLIESDTEQSRLRTLENRDELVAAIEQHFGMPREIVSDAVAELGSLQDAWT